jgi:hypothetical protein
LGRSDHKRGLVSGAHYTQTAPAVIRNCRIAGLVGGCIEGYLHISYV